MIDYDKIRKGKQVMLKRFNEAKAIAEKNKTITYKKL